MSGTVVTSTSFLATGLTPNASYDFSVLATNPYGSSKPATITVKTPPGGVDPFTQAFAKVFGG